MNHITKRFIYLLLLGILALHRWPMVVTAEMEATWTPNDKDDGGGPLPLSMNQRQELLELEEAIRTSPNPQETLIKVAEANQMAPEELINLLQRNRQDLQAAGGGGGPRRPGGWPAAVAHLAGTTRRWVVQHPKTATVLATTLAATAYGSWTIPRTGLVLSTRASLWSKGATTWFTPPTAYLERCIATDICSRPVMVSKSLFEQVQDEAAWEKQADKSDGAPHHVNLAKKAGVRSVTTIATVLSADDLRGNKFDKLEDDVVLEAAWEQGVSLVGQRAVTEFCKPDVRLCMVDEHGILTIQSMGDFGRYALVPLHQISPMQNELDVEDSRVALTLNTVKGAHWDGQIHIQLDLTKESKLVVRVTMLFPKKGPSKRATNQIAQALHDSILTSLRTRTRQALARQSQSARFQRAAEKKAASRRTTRAAKERALEEMAADRRRRWQRKNPNSGSYRPSGERMRSPNNAVYY